MGKKATAGVPAGLGEHGGILWADITERFELRRDELRALEDACRTADLIQRLEEELAEGDLIVRGSMGQPVVNPLATELRGHRSVLVRLLSALHLPDEEGEEAGGARSRSTAARSLANARWKRGA